MTMTADEVKAAYAAVIGSGPAQQLADAGLLPTTQEVRWRQDETNRVTTATRDTIPNILQARYCTDWADLPESVTGS